MKKLLVIGASVLQLPAIIKAKKMGFFVGTLDYDKNAVGIPYADEFFCESTIDIEAVKRVALKFKPNGIMTLASDMPMRSVAGASSLLGLNSISMETAVKATDKGEMIKAFKEHGVASPWYFICKDKSELIENLKNIAYPAIMKPLDNAGSRGIVLAKNRQELLDGFAYSHGNSRGAGVIVEEYMTGREVSVETMTVDGETHILAVTDKLTTGAPHFVEMGHSEQTSLPPEMRKEVENLAKKAIKAVGINVGPSHVEIMVTDNGPKMVELGARMGGDCITTHLVPLSTGIDMIKATINVACKETPDLTPKFNKGSAIRFIKSEIGKITKISGVENAKKVDGVTEITFTKSVGDMSVEINSSTDRIGFIIAQSDTAEGAVKACEKALSLINIEIEKV